MYWYLVIFVRDPAEIQEDEKARVEVDPYERSNLRDQLERESSTRRIEE